MIKLIKKMTFSISKKTVQIGLDLRKNIILQTFKSNKP